MTEFRIKSAPWPPPTFRATVTPAIPLHGINLLQHTHMRLCEAEQLYQHRNFDHAQKICETLIREHPTYMAAHHLLGLIHGAKKDRDRAFDHLSRAAMLNPRSWTTLTALGGVCLELQANDMAALILQQARAIKPRDANVLMTLGRVYIEEREYERAKETFREAVALKDDFHAIMALGFVCRELGQNAEAAEVYESLIKRGMSTLEVLFGLSNLPSACVNVDLLAELEKLPRGQAEDTREFDELAAFVRATALDKAGHRAAAWKHLAQANHAIFLATQEIFREGSERQNAALTTLREDPINALGDNRDNRQPISLFILGPSRCGKSTMEQLVATLDGVKRGYENQSVGKAIRRTFQSARLLTSDRIGLLPPQLYPQCRDVYLEELAQRIGSARVFTNTTAPYIHEAQLIASVFPNVRFIFLKRNVRDNILRMYQKKYRRGKNVYSYDLKAARDHVAWYHQMMDLMAKKFPDIVRIINYEDMVANPAAAVGVAASLCGLSQTDGPLPDIGDDRGCAEPYHDFIGTELNR
jgi:Flp pilus assembly protein TadD